VLFRSQLLTFALDGKAPMPKVGEPVVPRPLVPADFQIDTALADKGREIYVTHCVICHGAGAVSGGYAPDLRASPIFLSLEALKAVVQDGAKRPNGMPRYADLNDADLKSLQHFVRQQAAGAGAVAAAK
jgi:quinohemoprotein ethanol dehydrogenase